MCKCKKTKDYPAPSPEQLRALFQDSMLYEILQTFGIPQYMDLSDYFQWEAVNYSRLVHARLLADFFELTKRKQEDDVLAKDFGFGPCQILSKPDRTRLNKGLLHLSYGRVGRTPEEKQWSSSVFASLHGPTV